MDSKAGSNVLGSLHEGGAGRSLQAQGPARQGRGPADRDGQDGHLRLHRRQRHLRVIGAGRPLRVRRAAYAAGALHEAGRGWSA